MLQKDPNPGLNNLAWLYQSRATRGATDGQRAYSSAGDPICRYMGWIRSCRGTSSAGCPAAGGGGQGTDFAQPHTLGVAYAKAGDKPRPRTLDALLASAKLPERGEGTALRAQL